MTHDPLCYQGMFIRRLGVSVAMCTCAVIKAARADEREQAAKRVADPTYLDGYMSGLDGYMSGCEEARADERERAAQRVEALCWHTKHEGSLPCAHDEAAAAVRGVQP